MSKLQSWIVTICAVICAAFCVGVTIKWLLFDSDVQKAEREYKRAMIKELGY